MFLAGSLLASFVEDPGAAGSTFSPDGSHLVVVRTDGTVQIRTRSPRSPSRPLRTRMVCSTSPHGAPCCGADGTVQIRRVHRAAPHGLCGPAGLSAAAFSPDGTRLVTTSAARDGAGVGHARWAILTALEGIQGRCTPPPSARMARVRSPRVGTECRCRKLPGVSPVAPSRALQGQWSLPPSAPRAYTWSR